MYSSADLEVQLVQLNHCDGVFSNYWNTLLRNLKLSPYINFLSRSALALINYLFTVYVQDKWNYYILFTQEIKTHIFDFSFFIKGSYHIRNLVILDMAPIHEHLSNSLCVLNFIEFFETSTKIHFDAFITIMIITNRKKKRKKKKILMICVYEMLNL